MAISETKTTLLRFANQRQLRLFLIEMFKVNFYFEILDPSELDGTKNLIHHYRPVDISKSEKHLEGLVRTLVDKIQSKQKKQAFVDTRLALNVEEFDSYQLTYESIYKLEKKYRSLQDVPESAYTQFLAYISKHEFITQINQLVSLSFNFEDKNNDNAGWYICICVPLSQYNDTKSLVQKFKARELAIPWKTPISVWNTNSYIRPFKNIASNLGNVSSKDIDSTVLISFFFALFFGFCVADAVYGLVLLIASGYLILKKGTTGSIKNMSKIFFFSGITSTLLGVLSGSWAGDLISNEEGKLLDLLGIADWGVFQALRSLQVVDPINSTANVPFNRYLASVGLNPIVALLGMSILIGLCVILSGYIINTINNFRNNNIAEARESSAWLILLFSILIYGGVLAVGESSTVQLIWQLVIGFAVLLVFLVNSSKGIMGKIVGGFGTLWGLIGFFADILSFTRLIAVGLTGGIIGSVINLLSSLVYEAVGIPIVSFVFLLILLFAGHLFNFVITIFGAYINPLRLSYVEYLPKFISSSERNFEPEFIKATYNKLDIEL